MANTPMPTATTVTPVNAGGSNKSTPSPKVGVPASLKKWLWLGVIVVTIVIIIALIASIKRDHDRQKLLEQKQQAAVNAPQRADGDCTYSRPCASVLRPDGSTEKVSIKAGQVCFEASFWDNLERLGFMTSYLGGEETKYTCTREQVIAGTCNQRIKDTFRFVPDPGVPIPKYWTVDKDEPNCS